MSRTTATAAQFNRLMEMLDNRQRDEALAAARRKHFEKFQVGAERFPGSMRRERISRVGRYSVRGEKMLAYTVTDTDGTGWRETRYTTGDGYRIEPRERDRVNQDRWWVTGHGLDESAPNLSRAVFVIQRHRKAAEA